MSPSVYHKSRQENRKNYVMTKSTPNLTQSGPLAVLLQLQLDRHAHRKHMRAAFWKILTWPFRALTARTLVDYPGAGNRFTTTCGSNIPNGSSQMANPPCASWKSSTL